MNLREKYYELKSKLASKYDEREAVAMTRVIFDYLLDYSPTDIILHYEREISDYISEKADEVVARVIENEPIQYVVGWTRFYGNRFYVNRNVLIPRPETEELVEMIVGEFGTKKDLSVMDICTGSGCIAVSLAKHLPYSDVEAIDISEKALEVARENALNMKAKVRFYKEDALNLNNKFSIKYDIIVSNPPYVLEKEKTLMSKNVLDYEPEIALFVPDSEPLRFYKPILKFSRTALNAGGKIYMEINPLCSDMLEDYAMKSGFANVEIVKDMAGNERFLVCH